MALGPRLALLASAGGYLLAMAVIALWLTGQPMAMMTVHTGRSTFAACWSGNVAIFRVPAIRLLMLAHRLPAALCTGAEALIIPYVKVRSYPPGAAGWLLAALPLGMIVGNLTIGRLLRDQRLGQVMAKVQQYHDNRTVRAQRMPLSGLERVVSVHEQHQPVDLIARQAGHTLYPRRPVSETLLCGHRPGGLSADGRDVQSRHFTILSTRHSHQSSQAATRPGRRHLAGIATATMRRRAAVADQVVEATALRAGPWVRPVVRRTRCRPDRPARLIRPHQSR